MRLNLEQISTLSNSSPKSIKKYSKQGIIPKHLTHDNSYGLTYDGEATKWIVFANELTSKSANLHSLSEIFKAAISKWGDAKVAIRILQDLFLSLDKGYSDWIESLANFDLDIPEGILLKELIKHPDIQTYIDSLEINQSLQRFDIKLQTLLHLPRFPFRDLIHNRQLVLAETERISRILEKRYRDHKKWLKPPTNPILCPKDTYFKQVSEETAQLIHNRFHYIGSARENSLHFGLFTKEKRLAAILSFSYFDLTNMLDFLPYHLRPEQVMVLSRGFTFSWAPPNQMSFLFARTVNWFKQNMPKVKMFVTYVNPNLGFTGASYRASNWIIFGKELDAKYSYLNQEYITDRSLIKKFGTTNSKSIMKKNEVRVEESITKLAPLNVFAFFLDKDMRMQSFSGYNYEFLRPKHYDLANLAKMYE